MNEYIAIYPRKGTETHPVFPVVKPWNCNLSPQGDGNEEINAMIFHLPIAILSPQGDGNFPVASVKRFATIAIYPRKGTETKPAWYN